jgi:hypothetical protein
MWLWEIGAAVLSIASQLANIAILAYVRDKAVSRWKAAISVNTAVSTFSTLSKSALLLPVSSCIGQLKWLHFEQKLRTLSDLDTFDSASRGPLGAMQLLWNVNRNARAASFGALITLVALTVDPFAQAVIYLQESPVSLGNNTASFPYAVGYDAGSVQLVVQPNDPSYQMCKCFKID